MLKTLHNASNYKLKNIRNFLFIGVGLIGIFSVTLVIKQPQSKTSSAQVFPVHSSSVKKSLPATKIAVDGKNLEKYLVVEAALLGADDNISLYFKDLNTENTISIDPSRSWIPASTIKAYVAIEAFRQERIGLINFDQNITIQSKNVVPTEMETNDFPILNEGSQVTIRQLVEMMITQSDNTAYNTLLDLLDRRNINTTLRTLGITETVVGEKLNLDDSQLQQDLIVTGRQPNTTTAKDFATLFDLLDHGQIADSDKILTVFKRQKINSMIPALLPLDIKVAHKTGDWAPIYHDGGIIYKPQNPFVLVLFTNSNDQTVLAKMAKVAYDQNADAVGNNAAMQEGKLNKTSQNTIHRELAYVPDTSVLGAETKSASSQIYIVQQGDTLWSLAERFYGDGNKWREITRRNFLPETISLEIGMKLIISSVATPEYSSINQKFPEITAADLGVKTVDVTTDISDVKRVDDALIIPGSIFYPIKRYFEQQSKNSAITDSQKVDAYLSSSQKRLSEIKVLLAKGQTNEITQILSESESDLQNATNLIRKDSSLSTKLLQVKQLTDLHYALFESNTSSYTNYHNKQQMVDDIYNFYEHNQRYVAPIVRASVVANPIQQQPIIGTVEKVEKNSITMKFDNGTTRTIPLSPNTTVRDFHSSTPDTIPTFQVGTKIAVIGESASTTMVQPLFILRGIPKELPDKHDGTVLDVNPKKNTIQILNKNGKKEEIIINDNTVIKGKDTEVTVGGITPGSRVTIFGENQSGIAEGSNHITAITLNPAQVSIAIAPSRAQTSTQFKNIKLPAINEKQPPILKLSPTASVMQVARKEKIQVIKATSITVTQNGNGKNIRQDTQNSVSQMQNKPITTTPQQNKLTPQNVSSQTSQHADTQKSKKESAIATPTGVKK